MDPNLEKIAWAHIDEIVAGEFGPVKHEALDYLCHVQENLVSRKAEFDKFVQEIIKMRASHRTLA